MSTYTNIAYDVDRSSRRDHLAGKEWTFHNLLPFRIIAYMRRGPGGGLRKLVDIPPHEKRFVQDLIADDELHFIYPTKENLYYEVVRPAFLLDDSRIVRIGDVVYEEKDTPNTFLHKDISGIRIHNQLTLPIDIYHAGHKLASIAGDDGTSFMNGAPNSAFVNNDGKGFRVGDELGFTIAYNNQKYGSVAISDRYVSDIIVGAVTQHYTPRRFDVVSYRIDEPNVMDQEYFR